MPDDLTCSAAGCAATTVVACSYVDRRGRACPTAWCPEHVEAAGDRPYCRRHAGVMRARLGDEQEAVLPDLEARAPGLIEWLARDLAGGVEAALMATGAGDSVVSEPAHSVHQARARERTWERSWRLCRHTGIVHRVCLQVADARDTEVAVIVDRLEVARLTPPWIAARLSGEVLGPDEDARRRAEFRETLLEAVRHGIAEERTLRPT
ncbi:MAG TPA: hypothetical protein VMU20_14535 [Candidatus Dormibacteraeota bacterium]|nr:hypothetical protein [Candidatus Dormibacteraeota bacterium]